MSLRPWLVACLAAPALWAAGFDPATDVGLKVDRGRLVVTLPPGVHLKCRTFRITLATGPGKLVAGPLPPAGGRDDVGDPVWRGTFEVPLRGEGLGARAELYITFQPCTEGADSVCYLPQHRTLPVDTAASGLR